jgi:hypothetical protein
MNMNKAALNAKKANPKKRTTTARTISQKSPSATMAKNKNGIIVATPDTLDEWDVHGMAQPKRQKMQVTMEDGLLVIRLPVNDPPRMSASGKSHVVATSYGVKRTSLLVDGLPVRVVATAFIYGYGESPAQRMPFFDLLKPDDDEDDDDAVEL